jgi:hypothetical protein
MSAAGYTVTAFGADKSPIPDSQAYATEEEAMEDAATMVKNDPTLTRVVVSVDGEFHAQTYLDQYHRVMVAYGR